MTYANLCALGAELLLKARATALALSLMSLIFLPRASWAFTIGVQVFANPGPALPCRGLSTVKGFENQIVVRSLSDATSRRFDPATGRLRTTPATAAPFTIVKNFDGCTPFLFLALVQGTPLPTVTFSFVADDAGTTVKFFEIELQNAHVISMQSMFSSEPLEEVSFVFETMKLTDITSKQSVTCDFVQDICR